MSLVPIADVAAWLKYPATPSGGEGIKLQATIDAAESYIAYKKGHGTILAPEAITQRTPGLGASLVLTTLPVISVTSVTGADGGTLVVGSLDVDTEHGLVGYTPVSRVIFPMNWYTVVYQAGFANLAALPAAYQQAVREVAREFWAPQRGTRPSSGSTFPENAMATADRIIATLPSYGFA